MSSDFSSSTIDPTNGTHSRSFGPARTEPATAELEQARRECRQIARSHYENFVVGSLLLPRRYRQAFHDVYAFCRTADDLADESASPDEATTGLHDYQRRIGKIFGGEPSDGIFIALADTISRYRLPREPFDALLRAFLQDQTRSRYEDMPQLLEYCSGSANPVGRLVLRIAGVHDSECDVLSDHICTALQLANFWQDIRRDHQKGRIYLPQSVMQQFGFDEQVLADGIASGQKTDPRIRQAVSSVCQQASVLFDQGAALLKEVPDWLAVDLQLFVDGGRQTLKAIERIDFDVLRTRPTVSRWQQAKLLALAIWKVRR